MKLEGCRRSAGTFDMPSANPSVTTLLFSKNWKAAITLLLRLPNICNETSGLKHLGICLSSHFSLPNAPSLGQRKRRMFYNEATRSRFWSFAGHGQIIQVPFRQLQGNLSTSRMPALFMLSHCPLSGHYRLLLNKSVGCWTDRSKQLIKI